MQIETKQVVNDEVVKEVDSFIHESIYLTEDKQTMYIANNRNVIAKIVYNKELQSLVIERV